MVIISLFYYNMNFETKNNYHHFNTRISLVYT